MKSLTVIDDTAIRKNAFREAELVIRKIDRLEASFEAFHQVDQKLFADWYALTFRQHEQRLRDLADEFRALATFHNEMVTVARMHGVSMHDAYRILRTEEASLRHGTEEEKMKIEATRKERDDFLRDEMEEEAREERVEAAKRAAGPAPLSEGEAKALADLHLLTDEEIRELCLDRANTLGLLSDVLTLMRKREDAFLLLRIWDNVAQKNKKPFVHYFASHWSGDFHRLIAAIRDDRDAIEHSQPKPEQGSEAKADSEPEAEYVGKRNKKERAPGEAEEALKLLYRKLVRRLHPDLQSGIQEDSSALAVWHKKIWNRLQRSYERRDQNDLEKILHLVLIRSRDLTLLTISEIIQSRSWLEEELASLNAQTKSMKKMPAWGFSRLKNPEKLERKLAGPLNDEIRILENEVIAMKQDQNHLDYLSRSNAEPRRKGRKRRERY